MAEKIIKQKEEVIEKAEPVVGKFLKENRGTNIDEVIDIVNSNKKTVAQEADDTDLDMSAPEEKSVPAPEDKSSQKTTKYVPGKPFTPFEIRKQKRQNATILAFAICMLSCVLSTAIIAWAIWENAPESGWATVASGIIGVACMLVHNYVYIYIRNAIFN